MKLSARVIGQSLADLQRSEWLSNALEPLSGGTSARPMPATIRPAEHQMAVTPRLHRVAEAGTSARRWQSTSQGLMPTAAGQSPLGPSTAQAGTRARQQLSTSRRRAGDQTTSDLHPVEGQPCSKVVTCRSAGARLTDLHCTEIGRPFGDGHTGCGVLTDDDPVGVEHLHSVLAGGVEAL